METPFLPNESPIREGAANLQRGLETVGGRLYLTNQRLVFESHRFNIQTGPTIIPLDSVTGIRKCWTRFLDLVPLFPNSVSILTKEGTEYRFVLNNRRAWIEAINQRLTHSSPKL